MKKRREIPSEFRWMEVSFLGFWFEIVCWVSGLRPFSEEAHT